MSSKKSSFAWLAVAVAAGLLKKILRKSNGESPTASGPEDSPSDDKPHLRRWLATSATIVATLGALVVLIGWYNSLPSVQARSNLSQGLKLEEAGRRDEARPFFQSAVILDPSEPEVYRVSGFFFLRSADWPQGIELLCQSLRWDPGNVEALVNLGIGYQTLRQYDDALIHMREAEALAPESSFVLRNLSATLISLGRAQEALDVASLAISIDDHPVAWANYALGLLETKRYSEAREVAADRTADDPSRADDFRYIAIAGAIGSGDVTEAKQLAIEAGWSVDALAWVMLREGFYELAIEAIQDPSVTAPRTSSQERILALSYIGLGDLQNFNLHSSTTDLDEQLAQIELERIQTELGYSLAGVIIDDPALDRQPSCEQILARSEPFRGDGGS